MFGFSSNSKKKSFIQPQTNAIRKVLAPTKAAPATNGTSRAAAQANGHAAQPGAARRVGQSHKSLAPRQKRRPKSAASTPAPKAFGSDSEGASDDNDYADARQTKKLKVDQDVPRDLKRKIRDIHTWDGADSSAPKPIHSYDMTNAAPNEYVPALQDGEAEGGVGETWLNYPCPSQRERFQHLKPKASDGHAPISDILETIEQAVKHYLPPDVSARALDESSGIPFRVRRAYNKRDAGAFAAALAEYNAIVASGLASGAIAAELDAQHAPAFELVERILTQVYVRTVSPHAESLKGKAAAHKDVTYGELLPAFAAEIFARTGLDSASVFLDLGSGVGNVVLQAALQTGAEAHGMELSPTAAALAQAQEREFHARCRLWGLAPGPAALWRGDFTDDARAAAVLRRADVVLVNNEVFGPDTNDKLSLQFLDLKDGARLVSLKSFDHSGGKVSARNANSVSVGLETRMFEYWTGCVSWKRDGGTYFIATKKQRGAAEPEK